MTSVPAKVFGLKDRGVIREGAIADLVIFDPRTIIDSATFEHSKVPAEGIHTVIVGGEIVWQHGKPTGRRPGPGAGEDGGVAEFAGSLGTAFPDQLGESGACRILFKDRGPVSGYSCRNAGGPRRSAGPVFPAGLPAAGYRRPLQRLRTDPPGILPPASRCR